MMSGIPLWVVSAALAGVIGFGAGWSWNGSRHEAAQREQKIEAVQQTRTEEVRRTDAVEKVVEDAAPKLQEIRADTDTARSELDGLRQAADAYARDLARCSASADRGQAATRAAMVLSDLLSRSEARNIELAAAFDEARQRGLTCEATYAAIRNR